MQFTDTWGQVTKNVNSRIKLCINIYTYVFSVYIKGLEKIWILGEDFGFKSFNKHYYLHDPNGNEQFMKEQYEIARFMNDKKASLDKNTISRFRNNFVGAIHDQVSFP